MNVDNRQFGYTSQQNKNNFYIDDIRFDPKREGFARQRQISYVIDRFASVSDCMNHIGPDTQIIRDIRDDVKSNPSKYGGITVTEFLNAYKNIFEGINEICILYNRTGKMNDAIFARGFSSFNENLYNNLVDGKLHVQAFVHGTVLMGNSLAPLYTPAKR